MRWRQWWSQLGGPNALSWWSWWLILAPAVLISLPLKPAATTGDYLVWLLVLLGIQIVIGALMWSATRWVLPRQPGQSRPLAAVVVFVGLGAVRLVLVTWWGPVFGAVESTLENRIFINLVVGPFLLAVIAIFVDTYRRHIDVMRRLTSAQAHLMAVREAARADRESDDRVLVADVIEQITSEMQRDDVDPDEIRRVARDIVRSRSHELARTDVDVVPDAPPDPDRRLAVGELWRRLRIPSPWVTALVLEVPLIPLVIAAHGVPAAIVNFIVAGAVVVLVLSAFRWAWPRFPVAIRNGWTVLAAGISVGFLVPTIVWWVMVAVGIDFEWYVTTVVPVATFETFGIALVAAIGRAIDADEQRQLNLVEQVAREIEDLRLQTSEHRRRIAAFLHGPIQSELLKAAAQGLAAPEALTLVQERFDDLRDAPDEVDAGHRITTIVQAWSSVLDIELDAPASVLMHMQQRPGAVTVISDALSEALTNALRHAESTDVQVVVREVDGGFELRVRSDGEVTSTRAGDGFGLANLSRMARSVDLVSGEGRTELVVCV